MISIANLSSFKIAFNDKITLDWIIRHLKPRARSLMRN